MLKLNSFVSRLSITMLLMTTALFTNNARACHYGAGDIYVTYIGAGQDGCTGTTDYTYEVTVTIYLACLTCHLDYGGAAESVIVSSVNAGAAGAAVTYPMVDINGSTAPPDTVHSLCPNASDSNSCKDLSFATKYPAFRRRIFRTNVTLPNAQTDWRFAWSNGGRSPVPNIGGGCGTLYAECMLNNVAKYNNSSPRFSTVPLPYLCVNQPNVFLNGPIDINGDSLQVFQHAPYSGTGAQCTFNPGFSVTDPIGSAASNPYTLNPVTGAATFTPINQGQYVLAFRAEEYERGTGVKLGHIFRDVQVSVLACTEPPPSLDSLTPTLTVNDGAVVPIIGGGKAVVTCPDNKLNFTLNSRTSSPGHFLYMYANTSIIPGSTFTTTGAGTTSVTGTFNWTPNVSDIGEHTLIITSADSSCTVAQPIVLKNYTVVYIKVIGGLDAGKDVSTCYLNPPTRQLFVKGYGNLDINFKWTDVSGGPAKFLSNDTIHNPVTTANENTTYVVYSPELKANCKSRDTVLVYIDTSNTLDIFPQETPFVMCRPNYLQLDASVKGKGPLSNVLCGPTTLTNITSDSLVVWGSATYGTGISYDTAGTTAPVLTNQRYTAKFQYLVRKQDLLEYGLRPGQLRSMAFEVARNQTPTFEYANFTISLKCTNKTELTRAGGFESGMIQVYKAPGNIQLPDQWHKFVFDTPYNWDTTKNIIVEICYNDNPVRAALCTSVTGLPGLMKYMPTSYIGGLELIPTDTATKSVCTVTTSPDIKENVARPVFRFDFADAPGLPFNFIWSPGQFLSDSTSKQPLAYVPRSVDYVLQTFGKNGCMLRDTINIIVPDNDFYVLPKDTSICFGETAPLSVKNGTYFEWFEFENGKFKSAHESLNCDRCPNPIAKPKKTTHYKIKVGDELFCYDTIDAFIEVKPLPIVKILTNDTVIKYGKSIQLMVNGARLYNWTPVSSLNNPNISYPVATPTESTQYVVGGIASNGCVSFDTVRVGLDYRDNLFIPTAFSPNGDGKNDVFKVSNMTFQRYTEFRVFNRWGQEIYNGNKGWDGMWKGVVQEAGVYTYLIRVAYPDGEIETYKGDVTLVK